MASWLCLSSFSAAFCSRREKASFSYASKRDIYSTFLSCSSSSSYCRRLSYSARFDCLITSSSLIFYFLGSATCDFSSALSASAYRALLRLTMSALNLRKSSARSSWLNIFLCFDSKPFSRSSASLSSSSPTSCTMLSKRDPTSSLNFWVGAGVRCG